MTNGHGLRTPREEIVFTARLKIQSQSQIFTYGQSIFCLPHRPNFSDIFDLCLHWVSIIRGCTRNMYAIAKLCDLSPVINVVIDKETYIRTYIIRYAKNYQCGRCNELSVLIFIDSSTREGA